MLKLEKIKPDLKRPKLPTIQSNDLTPFTLESVSHMKKGADDQTPMIENRKTKPAKDKNSSKHKLVSMKTNLCMVVGRMGLAVPWVTVFFKNKNMSKNFRQGTIDVFHYSNKSQGTLEYTPYGSTRNTYQDIFSSAYHNY